MMFIFPKCREVVLLFTGHTYVEANIERERERAREGKRAIALPSSFRALFCFLLPHCSSFMPCAYLFKVLLCFFLLLYNVRGLGSRPVSLTLSLSLSVSNDTNWRYETTESWIQMLNDIKRSITFRYFNMQTEAVFLCSSWSSLGSRNNKSTASSTSSSAWWWSWTWSWIPMMIMMINGSQLPTTYSTGQ